MSKDYVEQRDGGYYVAGTRVSLDSIVYAYLRGESPEGIGDSFPSVSLESIHGALAFYLGNRPAIDAYLKHEEQEYDRMWEESRRKNPRLYAKLEAAKAELQSRRT